LTTVGAASLILSGLGFAGSASAGSAAPLKDPVCSFHLQHSIVEMGEFSTESSFAAVIRVSCEPVYSQSTVTIDASELSNGCHNTLSWAEPPSAPGSPGPQFTVKLDNDGNATAVVWGGPSCAPTRYHIQASLNATPFTTIRTTLTLLPPGNTKTGVTANPKSEVEDNVFSSVATVIRVEFPSVQAEQWVQIKSDELQTRCAGGIHWWGPLERPFGTGADTLVQLDNNGNAFVVAIAGTSCASGTSTITAELRSVPFTTLITTFTILSPRPLNP
jgi:hypothetical protein